MTLLPHSCRVCVCETSVGLSSQLYHRTVPCLPRQRSINADADRNEQNAKKHSDLMFKLKTAEVCISTVTLRDENLQLQNTVIDLLEATKKMQADLAAQNLLTEETVSEEYAASTNQQIIVKLVEMVGIFQMKNDYINDHEMYVNGERVSTLTAMMN